MLTTTSKETWFLEETGFLPKTATIVLIVLSVLSFIGIGIPAAAADPKGDLVSLPLEEHRRVDEAIKKGVDYLKKTDVHTGEHGVAYAAITGLTLLECDEPAASPKVQEAANFVRKNVHNLNHTYTVSLVILFFDRLGDPQDREAIRTLALRLIAGQLQTGGWTYTCGHDNEKEFPLLLAALQAMTPKPNEMLPGMNLAPGQKSILTGLPENILSNKASKGVPADLPQSLKKLPVLNDFVSNKAGGGDNSNTQFAILALWAARRYDIHMERTFALMLKRFQTSQNSDGSWDYHYDTNPNSKGRATMTGVGLLGLAVGHGLAYDISKAGGAGGAARDAKPMEDEMIKKGFTAFGRHIQEELPHMPRKAKGGGKAGAKGAGKAPEVSKDKKDAMHNLYFLWTLERVAVLYQQKTIDGKDWYAWGANYLCDVQQPAGNWHNGNYSGSAATLDTCLQRHVLVLRQPMRIVIADVIKGGKQAEWLLHTDKKADISEEGPGHVLVQAGKAELRIQTALPAKPAISIERGKKKTQSITLAAPVASTPFVVALLPGKAAAKPATVTESGFTFPTGETVKWNFKDGAALCLADGPNGVVAGQASRIDLPWITMRSTRPVNISVGKDGKGTLAVLPGGDKAKVQLVINGREKEVTVAPDSYMELTPP